jgi:hypothetical protein
VLARATAFIIGLLAGAMLFIGVALVPFWQRLPSAEFRAWFALHSGRIGALMIPLGIAAVIVSLAALIHDRRGPHLLAHLVAFAVALVVAIVTTAINEPANVRYAAPTGLSDAETIALLARWKRWHWPRVTFGVIAFAASLAALR